MRRMTTKEKFSKKKKKSKNNTQIIDTFYEKYDNQGEIRKKEKKSKKTNDQRKSKKIIDLDFPLSQLSSDVESSNGGFESNIPKRSCSSLSLFGKKFNSKTQVMEKNRDSESLTLNKNPTSQEDINTDEESTNIEEDTSKKRKHVIDLT